MRMQSYICPTDNFENSDRYAMGIWSPRRGFVDGLYCVVGDFNHDPTYPLLDFGLADLSSIYEAQFNSKHAPTSSSDYSFLSDLPVTFIVHTNNLSERKRSGLGQGICLQNISCFKEQCPWCVLDFPMNTPSLS